MRRARALLAIGATLIVLALALSACGGGDGETTTSAPASGAPSQSAPSPSPSALPPGLAECYAEEGYEITSPTEIHTAPQAVVEACFESLHQEGGAP